MLIADKKIQFWNITLRSQHFYKHFKILVSNELQIFRKCKSEYGPMEGKLVKPGAVTNVSVKYTDSVTFSSFSLHHS